MSDSRLEARHVSKTFGSTRVLDDVELTVAPGQRYDLEVRFDDDAREAWTLRAMVLVGLTDGGVETRPFPLVTAQMGEAVAPRPAYVPPERMLPDPDPASFEERTWNLSGGIDGGVVEFTINGVDLAPAEKSIEWGRKIIAYRVDQMHAAIQAKK